MCFTKTSKRGFQKVRVAKFVAVGQALKSITDFNKYSILTLCGSALPPNDSDLHIITWSPRKAALVLLGLPRVLRYLGDLKVGGVFLNHSDTQPL